ncbi:MAG: response regulator [Candidatus Omnitrophica bacterium]|nr:response regulator [Candidatus Omnitrophota bacterium]
MPKLLVVDDEHDICDFVKNFFQERGFEVFTASNGDEALAMVKEDKPDIVLLDVKMKGMDGIAALKHIKDIDRSLKVIMVTALEDQDKMVEASKLGACDYITKPLVLDHLEQTVDKRLKEMPDQGLKGEFSER